MNSRPHRASKWLRRAQFLACVSVGFLVLSTFSALVQFQWNKRSYPQVSYPGPDFRPKVTWSKERPSSWVRLSSLPRAAGLAVIAAEDGGFFRHAGVEWGQSLTKIRSDFAKFRVPHGISTLNQQIVKNLYFGARPPLLRKAQELVVAQYMDSQLSKKQILETYLNIAEWGPGVVGIGQASLYYFKKPASKLTSYECALLANLLPNPRIRGAWVRKGRIPRELARRVSRTLRRLSSVDRGARAALLSKGAR